MSGKKPSVFVATSIVILVMALALPALAQGRGGGGGGGGGRQGGGGPGGGPPPGGGGGGGRPPGGPGAPGGPGHGAGRPVYGPGYGGRYPYYGYGYRYYGYPYAYGWYGYPYFSAGWGWGWPYGGYPYYYPYAAGAYAYDASAALRLEVTPKEAEVFVDGYLVGTVDDYDGTFQRLRVEPGGHELTLYRDGFKTVHQSLQLSPGATFKVSYKMEPLAAGEVAEPRPTPPPPPTDGGEGSQASPRRPPASRAPAGFGTLAVRVQPADAVVLIDGEPWQSSGLDRLVVEVPEGPHRIEIRKDGFNPFSTEVTIAPGQMVPINVSLAAGR